MPKVLAPKGTQIDPPSEDPWAPTILEYLARTEYPTVPSILTVGVGVPADRCTHRDRRRVKAILRELGWTKGAPQYPRWPSTWVAPPGWDKTRPMGVLVPLVRPAAQG